MFPLFTEDNLIFPFMEKVDDSTLIFELSFPSFTYQSTWVYSPNPCNSCQDLPLLGKANLSLSQECTPSPQVCLYFEILPLYCLIPGYLNTYTCLCPITTKNWKPNNPQSKQNNTSPALPSLWDSTSLYFAKGNVYCVLFLHCPLIV